MSATRPAIELSIGIIARSASPPSTAAKTSSNDAHGERLVVGVVLRHTRWELAPGSPW